MRVLTTICALLVLTPLSLAGQDSYAVGKTVVFIKATKPDRTPVAGTGFLLASAEGRVCLITVQHIARYTNADSTIILLSNEIPVTLKLGEISATNPPAWVMPEVADIAALALKVPKGMTLHVFRRVQVLSAEALPPRERPVMVFGFPKGIGVSRFTPVSQQFTRASEIEVVTSDVFERPAEYYFLDRPSIEGYSGAPVFHVPGSFTRGGAALVFSRGFTLVGVMAGTLSDKTGGKLGAVVPPRFIAEVFDKAVTQVSSPKTSPNEAKEKELYTLILTLQ